MIRKLSVEGVTVFPCRQEFSFVPGINVIVGENDSGKSHLMKLCYALCFWGRGGAKRELPEIWAEEKRLRQVLLRVFGIRDLSVLVSKNGGGAARAHVSLEGGKAPLGTAETGFFFRADREEDGVLIEELPKRYLTESSLFLSPREVLSVYPCYMQAGKRYPELLDAADWELCRALEEEPKDISPNGALRNVLRDVEMLLSGRLARVSGRFYLQRSEQDFLSLNLVAEGFKRIGTLGLLIDNGSICRGSSLFWDEPETSLNTAHMPQLVRLLTGLCRAGVQVMISTHSLFLLRELTIQLSESRNRGISRRYIGLNASSDGGRAVRVVSGDALEQIGPIASLEAEMEQADRYLRLNRNHEEL